MVKKIPYVYSAVLVGAVGVGAVLLMHNKVLNEVWQRDTLWICTMTLVIAAFCFFLSFWDEKYISYGMNICPSLGFLGTVVGFILMIQALDQGADVWGMRTGLAIAVYTTAVGLVCALVLYTQKIALRLDRKQVSNPWPVVPTHNH